MLAKNLVHQAVLAGHSARFLTATDLVLDLNSQETSRALERRLRAYARPHLLAIDEIGYLAYDAHAADLLFQIVSRRYEQRSLVVTTNLPFKQWDTIFPNASCAVALIDRLTHHSEIIPIDGGQLSPTRCRTHAQIASVATIVLGGVRHGHRPRFRFPRFFASANGPHSIRECPRDRHRLQGPICAPEPGKRHLKPSMSAPSAAANPRNMRPLIRTVVRGEGEEVASFNEKPVSRSSSEPPRSRRI